jgi:hypothetical protein
VLAVDSAGRRPNFHALGAGILAQATPEALAAARSMGFFHYAGIGGPRLDGGPGAGIVQAARGAGAIVTCDLISPQASALNETIRFRFVITRHLRRQAKKVLYGFGMGEFQKCA